MESKTIAILDSVFWFIRVSAAVMLVANSVSNDAVSAQVSSQIQLQEVSKIQVQLVKRISERKNRHTSLDLERILVGSELE